MKMELAGFVYRVLLRPRPLRIAANAILTAMLPATRDVGGARVHLNPNDPVLSGALTLGVYENDVMALFERVIEPGMVFVDAGANVGLYTALAIKHIRPPGRILCIEPDPESRVYLQRTIQTNRDMYPAPDVQVHALALLDRPGEGTLYRNPENKADRRIYPDALCPDAIPVRTETLDRLMEQAGLRELHLLKMDVQGAEAKVIDGAADTLRRSPDCIVISEFWPHAMVSCGSSPDGFLAKLAATGLHLYVFSGVRLKPVEDYPALIRSCGRRRYRNIVGLKGRFAGMVSAGQTGRCGRSRRRSRGYL